MSDRPGLLSRAALAAGRALGLTPPPAAAQPIAGVTPDASPVSPPTPSPGVTDSRHGLGDMFRRTARAVADGFTDLFAGKFFEGQEHIKDVLDGGWQPRVGYTDFILEILGRTGLPRRILALRALDATREGWSVRFPTLEPEAAAKAAGRLAQQQKDLGVQAAIYRGLLKAENFGEAIVVIGVDDGGRMEDPLDLSAVQKVLWLKVFARPDYQPGPLSPPTSTNFDLPEFYDLHDFTKPALSSLDRAQRDSLSAVRVHHTRVLRFNTEDGTSRLDEIAQALEDYFAAMRSSRRAGATFSLGKFSISNWIAKITGDDTEAMLRMNLQKQAMQQLGAVIVDKEQEDFSYLGQPGATALPPIVDRAAINLCAWTGYPAMVLFGQDPAGFSTGEEVIRRYYDTVRVIQKLQIERPLRYLLQILMVSEDGPDGIVVQPEDWTVQFAPLRTLSAKETAELRNVVFDGVIKLKTAQVIDRKEARATVGRDEGELVPPLRLGPEVAEDRPQERVEVGIAQAIQAALTEYSGGTPSGAAERALWSALVPELAPVAAEVFADRDPASLVGPDGRPAPAPEAADELADSDEPAPTPGVPPPGERTADARAMKERYGTTLATLKRWIAEGKIRGWRTGGDRGRWRVLESEVALAAAHAPTQRVVEAGAGGEPGVAPDVTGGGEDAG